MLSSPPRLATAALPRAAIAGSTARPDLTRVRLELARALYACGAYDQARFHFERALGEDPPAAARSNIERTQLESRAAR
jgi:hypothetical protein